MRRYASNGQSFTNHPISLRQRKGKRNHGQKRILIFQAWRPFFIWRRNKSRKMADRGKLPGRRVGGKWRFSTAELHCWFEDRIGLSERTRIEPKLKKVLDRQTQEGHDSDIHIPSLLAASTTFIPFPARTKSSVIEKICELSSQSGRTVGTRQNGRMRFAGL